MGELAFNGFLLLSFVGLAVYSADSDSRQQFLARYWPMGILIGLIVLMSIKICNLWKNMKPEERQFKIKFEFFEAESCPAAFGCVRMAGDLLVDAAICWLFDCDICFLRGHCLSA